MESILINLKKLFARQQEIYIPPMKHIRFTQMIGINPFEGLWGNFLDDHDEFRKMKEIVPGYRKDAWTTGLKTMGLMTRIWV